MFLNISLKLRVQNIKGKNVHFDIRDMNAHVKKMLKVPH